jgi:acyl-CoA reductase-like NAD-dependent aldehyde dehydrogenase
MTALNEFTRLSGTALINGEYRASAGQRHDVTDPATGQVIGQYAEATEAEVDAALEGTRAAQAGWWALSGLERAEALHEVARRVTADTAVVAEMLTREMGKTYKESADEIAWSVTALDYYAEIGRHEAGRVIGPATAGQLHYTIKEPLGTVVIVLPFNYPLVLLCWEAAAALAVGNAVVIKPSEYTSLTTLRFLEAFDSLPTGLVQCVTGGGAVGRRLGESHLTDMIAFTGSVPTGQAIAAQNAQRFRPQLIEASGNDAFIVMPSAPLRVAARGAAFAAFLNCGQVCTSAERFYVHDDIYDEFAALMVEEARAIRVGNGLDKVDMGPMVNAKERDRYESIIARAVDQGARIVTGGGRPAGLEAGNFVEPTVLLDVKPDFEILHRELFGPAAPLCRVSSFDEAIALANDSEFGLGANIYTTNLGEAIAATDRLQVGMVWVNAPLLDNDAGPFGGRKMTGMGRQLGYEGLAQFQHTKLVMIDPQVAEHDFWWFPYADDEMAP